jgi:hypothetical protein
MRIVYLLVSIFLFGVLVPAQSIVGPKGAINFDKVNVCAKGQSSPQPCNRVSKINYNITASTTFGTTEVVTQGVANLDFTLSATSCTGTLAAGSSCSVTARFTPRTAGVRMGAVQLNDSSGNLLLSTYIYGSGQAPVAAFNPGAQRTLPVTGFDGSALAADAAGNVYFSAGTTVAKFDIRSGAQTTVATGFNYVGGLAIDGAGNLFVSENNVVKVAAGTSVQTPVGTNLNSVIGVAVDGRGNIYAGDDWDNGQGLQEYPRLAEVFAATGGEQTLLGGYYYGLQGLPLLDYPVGVAVDGSGNAYVACVNYGPLYESVAGTSPEKEYGIIASRQFTAVGNFTNPYSVATDAAGDVYATDGVNDVPAIYQVAANGGYESVVVYGPWDSPIAVDGAGNVFFGNNNYQAPVLAEAKGSVAATLFFGKTAIESTSAPQSITIQNVGTQPLNAVAPGLIVSTNFVQVTGPGTPADCSSTFALAPGALCNLSIVFAPQTLGTVRGMATFTDNALNKIPSASQSVTLDGTGIQ